MVNRISRGARESHAVGASRRGPSERDAPNEDTVADRWQYRIRAGFVGSAIRMAEN